MKRAAFLVVFTAIAAAAFGADVSVQIDVQMTQQDKNRISYYNPGDFHKYNTFEALFLTSLIAKTEEPKFASGYLNIEAQGLPISFLPELYRDANWENVHLKEVYATLIGPSIPVKPKSKDKIPLFTCEIGKRYLDWGQGFFFFPLDNVNSSHDLFDQESRTDGKTHLAFTFPVGKFADFKGFDLFFDAILQIEIPEHVDRTLLNFPFIPRFRYTSSLVDAFAYGIIQTTRNPIVGGSALVRLPFLKNPAITIVAEGAYKGYSDMSFVDEDYDVVKRSDKYYLAGLLGAEGKMAMSAVSEKFPIKEIGLRLEYYFDGENWVKRSLEAGVTENEFQRFIGYLQRLYSDYESDSTQSAALADKHYQALSLMTPFKNSAGYIYANIVLRHILLDDLNFDLPFVINLTDGSAVVMPQVTYNFMDSTLLTGLRGTFFIGSDKGGTEAADIAETTEFGQFLCNSRITLFARVMIR